MSGRGRLLQIKYPNKGEASQLDPEVTHLLIVTNAFTGYSGGKKVIMPVLHT